ncbi:hypothetical protein F7725_023677 [Dissostichus mawsoni]|uniref:C1q domain-containing protein n=1 Tax=Dissostichus mawsoni TaxID=36200 RepID=A0A7J5XX81_DISMA|nr:hypothetical protein F7725_023677 [Dissostichus mawsoni]
MSVTSSPAQQQRDISRHKVQARILFTSPTLWFTANQHRATKSHARPFSCPLLTWAKRSSSEKEVQELKRENAALEARMSSSENDVEEVKRVNAALENRMSSSEKKVEELQTENADLLARVTASENKSTEARMSSSEKQVQELKRENADLLARVTASENKSTAFEARMSSSEKEVLEIQTLNADRPQVAFSAGLTDAGLVGAFNIAITLKFRAYYFRFNLWGNKGSAYTAVELYHNTQMKMKLYDYNDGAGFVSASNVILLELEKGDVVYIVLLHLPHF